MIGYEALRAEQKRRARGELIGIGMSFSVPLQGSRRQAAQDMDILGRHGRRLRAARAPGWSKTCWRFSVQTLGPGPETTFAQIVAEGWDCARRHRGGARRHRPDTVRVRLPAAVPHRLGVIAAALVACAGARQGRIIASGHAQVSMLDLQWRKVPRQG